MAANLTCARGTAQHDTRRHDIVPRSLARLTAAGSQDPRTSACAFEPCAPKELTPSTNAEPPTTAHEISCISCAHTAWACTPLPVSQPVLMRRLHMLSEHDLPAGKGSAPARAIAVDRPVAADPPSTPATCGFSWRKCSAGAARACAARNAASVRPAAPAAASLWPVNPLALASSNGAVVET